MITSPRDDPADRAALVRAVGEGLSAYNRHFAPPSARSPLLVAARDEADRVVGGLVGETAWAASGRGWLYIEMLWVAPAVHGRGVGSRLLDWAEVEAARRGCRYAHLDTAEFQARPFYERRGYVVFGVQDDYPPGFRRYFLRKALAPASADGTPAGRSPEPADR